MDVKKTDNMGIIRYRALSESEQECLVDIIRPALSGSIFGFLGDKFIKKFYGEISKQPNSCLIGAFNEKNILIGMVIGVADHEEAYRATLINNFWRLAWGANFKILKPNVLIWILQGFQRNNDSGDCLGIQEIRARLLTISVAPEYKNCGVGLGLINILDNWFQELNISNYLIFTESSNVGANGLYKKLGCDRLCIRNHRAKQIAVWVRRLPNET